MPRAGLFVFAFITLSVFRAAHAQTDEPLRKLAEKYWDTVLEFHPRRATAVGDYRFNDKLEDVSAGAVSRWRARVDNYLDELHGIPSERLSSDDQLTWQLLERALQDDLRQWECHDESMPFDPLAGVHLEFPLLLVSQPFRDVADFRSYIARLRAFPKLAADTIANARAGIGKGWVGPSVIVEKVLPQIRAHIVEDPTQSEFYKPVEKAKGLSEADRLAVTSDIERTIRYDVIPSYQGLLSFLEEKYLPAARSTVGIGALPGGEKLYETKAYLNTTVKVSAEELHQLGLSEVARIRGEMAKVQAEVHFEGSLDDFLAHMRTNPRYRFTSREELIAAADAILQRTKPQLPKLFGRIPKADCVMKEIEGFRAQASPMAYYGAPPEDGSRPAYYYINTYAPQERLKFTLEALTYHEAVPGHHFQMALHQENKELPKFRRYASFTAYIEGWALYTEKLGYEIGGYADPESRFGQLTFEMWRACRLVVDSGMHMKGWTRRQAIDYMVANTSMSLLDLEAEVDRYIAWPGQALAYKVGEMRILKLRHDAEEALGARFDLRAFHDRLLAEGAMPIDMLEQRLRQWIASRKQGG